MLDPLEPLFRRITELLDGAGLRLGEASPRVNLPTRAREPLRLPLDAVAIFDRGPLDR